MIEIIEKIVDVPFVTPFGPFMAGAFRTRDPENGGRTADHVIVYLGLGQSPCNVRINSACYTGDIFLDMRCDCNWQFQYALQYIAYKGQGLVVYHMHHEGRANGVVEKLRSYKASGFKASAGRVAYESIGLKPDARNYNSAVVILRNLGIKSVNLITNNPEKCDRVERAGIHVASIVPAKSSDPSLHAFYDAKRGDYGHMV